MSDKNRHTVIPAVFLILKKDDEILLQRRFNTGFQDGQYTLPSGHIEKDETPTIAVCREGKEEVGVIIDPMNLKFEQVLYRRGFNLKGDGYDETQRERVDFFFSTEKWIGEPTITEPDKCDDLQWFKLSNLPPNLFPVVRDFLQRLPKQTVYQEAGFTLR